MIFEGHLRIGKGHFSMEGIFEKGIIYGRAFWWCFIIALPFQNYTSKNNPITFQLWPNSVTAKVVLVIRKVKVCIHGTFIRVVMKNNESNEFSLHHLAWWTVRGDLDGYLYKGIHDSHCDYDTIGDLDDLATMLTIANMMTMITTVDQISKLIIIHLFHAFSAYKTMYHALYWLVWNMSFNRP